MAAGTVMVPLWPGSDGDYMHKPPENSVWSIIDPPTLYLERIGLQWMQDRDEAKPGVKYMLERLPAGYTLYERPRSSGIKDKYLFGHPKHKYFDSPNRFYPHFKHMMDHDGDTMGWPCTVCVPRGGILPGKSPSTSGYFNKGARSSGGSSRSSRSSSRRMSDVNSVPTLTIRSALAHGAAGTRPKERYKPMGRPKTTPAGIDATHVDEEGTPDVYRNLIDRLKRQGNLDTPIKEPLSLDWRAEQEVIPDLLRKLQRDEQCIPRVGDIVLYVRNVLERFKIAQHPQTGEYYLHDPLNDTFGEKVIWEAGVVSQAPTQLNVNHQYEWSVSQTGVRLEPVPDPNDASKSLSKRYTYVPAEHTRPFCLWEDFIGYVSRDERHPTIQNAFTVSATMSLMGKHRFHGNWPQAQIYCHAIYIGSELIAVGDTVRLAPKVGDEDNITTDILVVKTIRLKLHNLDNASCNDYDDGRPYNSEVWIYGSGYTSVASHSSKEWLSDSNVEIPKAASGYADWYPLHPLNKELAVPFSRIVGRLYELDALESWVPDPDLDSGRDGVLDARHYASKNDKRIVSNIGTTWFWADSRADALDLETFNGLSVGKHDIERDPKEWRKSIKITGAGAAVPERPPGSGTRNLRDFLASGNRASTIPSKDSNSSGGSMTAKGKRPVIEVSDEEEEARRQTRIVTNIPYKKSKIQVVID